MHAMRAAPAGVLLLVLTAACARRDATAPVDARPVPAPTIDVLAFPDAGDAEHIAVADAAIDVTPQLTSAALVAAVMSRDHCKSLRQIAAEFVSAEDIERVEPNVRQERIGVVGRRHGDRFEGLLVPLGFDSCDSPAGRASPASASLNSYRGYRCASRAPLDDASSKAVLEAIEKSWLSCLPRTWRMHRKDPHDLPGVSFLRKYVPFHTGRLTEREGCRFWLESAALKMECSTQSWN
jgi:hypothetical protein